MCVVYIFFLCIGRERERERDRKIICMMMYSFVFFFFFFFFVFFFFCVSVQVADGFRLFRLGTSSVLLFWNSDFWSRSPNHECDFGELRAGPLEKQSPTTPAPLNPKPLKEPHNRPAPPPLPGPAGISPVQNLLHCLCQALGAVLWLGGSARGVLLEKPK